MTKFKVGDRVRVTESCAYSKESLPAGTELVIEKVDGDVYPYQTSNPSGGYPSGTGVRFKAHELEAITDEPEDNSRVELLEKTLREVHWIFMYYHDQHAAKGTDDAIYKAMFNHMIADRIANALATDS